MGAFELPVMFEFVSSEIFFMFQKKLDFGAIKTE